MADDTNLICPLCSLNISDDVEFQVICKSGVTIFINNGIQHEVGQRVHKECRKRYSKSLKFKKHDIESTPLPRLRRKTDEPAFNSKNMCFLCGTIALPDSDDFLFLRSFDCQYRIKEVAKKRNDEWGNIVFERINHVI